MARWLVWGSEFNCGGSETGFMDVMEVVLEVLVSMVCWQWSWTGCGRGVKGLIYWVVEVNGKLVSWKTTSMEMKISYASRVRTLYPFLPNGYPRNTHGLALGRKLSLILSTFVT